MTTARTKASAIALVTVLVAIATACEDGGPASSSSNARVSFYLTDAPGDVEQVWVEIEEVSVRVDGDWHVYTPEVTGLIELTALVDDHILLIGEQEYEASTISEIRVVIGDGVLLSGTGGVHVLGDPILPIGLVGDGALMCPSCQQSGIKIKVSGGGLELDEGAQVVLLDFDVAQTFGHAAGSSGMWVMHPVIHASLIVDSDADGSAVDDIDSGTNRIEGTVVVEADIPDCPLGVPRSVEDFLPLATATSLLDGDGETVVRAGAVGAGGSFHIAGVSEDDYAMSYLTSVNLGAASLSFVATVAPAEVTVPSAAALDVVYTVVDATCDV